jgi:predicted lysophospholipase L1 biosynthesis ABC-type transport system permease subunit
MRDRGFVAVVNQEFARHYMDGRDPVGTIIHACGEPTTIVGMVRDSKTYGFVELPRPVLYMPLQQRYGAIGEYDRGIFLFVRTPGEPKLAVPLVRKALASVDPGVGVYDAMPYEDYIGASVFAQKVAASLLTVLGSLSLLLSAIGIYSVMAYSVNQRIHEFGIRMALGGQRARMLGLVLRKGLVLTVSGLAAGVIAGLAGSQLIASMLPGVSPSDPPVFAGACVFLMIVALVACSLPAQRATRVDPMVALRCE